MFSYKKLGEVDVIFQDAILGAQPSPAQNYGGNSHCMNSSKREVDAGLLRSRLRYYASDALPASHYYKWFAKTVCGERALVNVLCERLRDTPWQPLQALSKPFPALVSPFRTPPKGYRCPRSLAG